MHARTSTFSADPDRLDAGVGRLRHDVMPELHGMDGFVGMSALVDRASGRCIATTAWRDHQAMRASADRAVALRDAAAEAMGGRDPEVAEWEFAGVHRRARTPAGAATRVVWGRFEPGRPDQVRDAHRELLLPRLDELPGFVSVTLLVDPDRAAAAVATTYADRATLERTASDTAALGEELGRAAGLEVTAVGEFELALAHLRVPELV